MYVICVWLSLEVACFNLSTFFRGHFNHESLQLIAINVFKWMDLPAHLSYRLRFLFHSILSSQFIQTTQSHIFVSGFKFPTVRRDQLDDIISSIVSDINAFWILFREFRYLSVSTCLLLPPPHLCLWFWITVALIKQTIEHSKLEIKFKSTYDWLST